MHRGGSCLRSRMAEECVLLFRRVVPGLRRRGLSNFSTCGTTIVIGTHLLKSFENIAIYHATDVLSQRRHETPPPATPASLFVARSRTRRCRSPLRGLLRIIFAGWVRRRRNPPDSSARSAAAVWPPTGVVCCWIRHWVQAGLMQEMFTANLAGHGARPCVCRRGCRQPRIASRGIWRGR